MNCPNCSKEIVPSSFFCQWCSRFIPAPGVGTRAGLFARWVAWSLDPILAVVAIGCAVVFSGMAGGAVFQDPEAGAVLGFLALLLFPVVYAVIFLVLLFFGQTPGKMLLGLQVVHAQTGAHPGFFAMFVRELPGRMISGALVGTGYLWAFFNDNRQALHDIMAGTVVIRRSRRPAPIRHHRQPSRRLPRVVQIPESVKSD